MTTTRNTHKYQIFKACEVYSLDTGWIVDLSPEGVVNSDFYYTFELRREAKKFRDLVETGTPVRIAVYEALS